jgi:hypothetical protein
MVGAWLACAEVGIAAAEGHWGKLAADDEPDEENREKEEGDSEQEDGYWKSLAAA